MGTPSPPTAGNLDQITSLGETPGGRRYNPSGQLYTSPKGALGEMQVMPSTIANPGFGIPPGNPNDPNDIARVGRQYRQAMQQRYGNDPAKMWGAYNAGPGRVDRLIGQHGDDWLQFAPPETQDYVARNLRRMRGF